MSQRTSENTLLLNGYSGIATPRLSRILYSADGPSHTSPLVAPFYPAPLVFSRLFLGVTSPKESKYRTAFIRTSGIHCLIDES